MHYRTFGRIAWRPSALGFGAMRLPTCGNDRTKIDEPLATRMIRTAIDAGVNYVDTAWPYHGGESEPFIGRVLEDGFRDRVKLATKLPSWLVARPEDMDHYLGEQLRRLGTDRIDFYLLHGLNRERWDTLRSLDVLTWGERAIADGRIGHLGFSFHDDLAVFKEIVDAHDWTFCQIMYNYMDIGFQAGEEGLKYAAERGLAVVVMEPLRGGQLTCPPPPQVAEIWDRFPTRRTPADWALQWVWNHPEVSLALSGMSAMAHVEENLVSAARSGVGSLGPKELDLIAEVRDAYRTLRPIPCTTCGYCQPCPEGVDIPRVFSIFNDLAMYGDTRRAAMSYHRFLDAAARADRCVGCGTCERNCPQQIRIIDWLKKVHARLAALSPD